MMLTQGSAAVVEVTSEEHSVSLLPNLGCKTASGMFVLRSSVMSDSFATPWTVAACQAPLSMEFSRQEYWSGLPFPPPGDLPNPRIEPKSPSSLALAGGFFSTVPPIYILLFGLFFIIGHYKILTIVTCAIYSRSLLCIYTLAIY